MEYQVGTVQNFKAVGVYDPSSNSRNTALLDVDTGLIIGFNKSTPYYACGGAQAVIDAAIDNKVLVPGSKVFGFKNWCCHGTVHRLGIKPDLV